MYTPKLNPKRGFIIERLQPVRQEDLDLVKMVLDENDEIVIGIGNAMYSHEPGNIMTAGERLEVTDNSLKSAGISPNRYILVPVENNINSATSWVAEVMMVTPRWNTFYTRNFKNASMFGSFRRQYGYKIKTIEEQIPEIDYYKELSESKRVDNIPESAIEKMLELGILSRVSTIYNRSNSDFNQLSEPKKRALFLGGLQPLTGVYQNNTGHMAALRLALRKRDEVVIAIGSSQECYKESDPLKAGARLEVVRYSLLANGVDASKFYIVPIKDIEENAKFANKVISLCPSFDSVIAGNDWTKRLFGEGNYETIGITRTLAQDKDLPISATYIRNVVTSTIKDYENREKPVGEDTIGKIESTLNGFVDKKTLDILREVGFYDIMKFLAFAKE